MKLLKILLGIVIIIIVISLSACSSYYGTFESEDKVSGYTMYSLKVTSADDYNVFWGVSHIGGWHGIVKIEEDKNGKITMVGAMTDYTPIVGWFNKETKCWVITTAPYLDHKSNLCKE